MNGHNFLCFENQSRAFLSEFIREDLLSGSVPQL